MSTHENWVFSIQRNHHDRNSQTHTQHNIALERHRQVLLDSSRSGPRPFNTLKEKVRTENEISNHCESSAVKYIEKLNSHIPLTFGCDFSDINCREQQNNDITIVCMFYLTKTVKFLFSSSLGSLHLKITFKQKQPAFQQSLIINLHLWQRKAQNSIVLLIVNLHL